MPEKNPPGHVKRNFIPYTRIQSRLSLSLLLEIFPPLGSSVNRLRCCTVGTSGGYYRFLQNENTFVLNRSLKLTRTFRLLPAACQNPELMRMRKLFRLSRTPCLHKKNFPSDVEFPLRRVFFNSPRAVTVELTAGIFISR